MCVPVYLYLYAPHSHLFELAIKMLVRHVPLGSASVYGRLYTKHTNHSDHTTTFTSPTHPLANSQNGLGCTLLQHPTSHVLLISSTPCQREFVCGACIGAAEVGASFAAPSELIFKRSSLRSQVSCDFCSPPCGASSLPAGIPVSTRQGGLEQGLVSAELKVSIMLRFLAGGSYLDIMYHHKY